MEQTFGKYQVQKELGQGGFATVYLAKNTMLGTDVALKVLNPTLAQDDKFIQRFQEEARQAALLQHPNIVRIIDFEEANGRYFITMDYVPGTDLQKHLQKENLVSLEQLVDILQQIGAALDYAHSKKLVHRDVKPSNILLGTDGVVKLTDFGIVRAAEGTRLTTSGAMMGTAVYMSPEQTRGVELDGRSDLYSLGVVAYELATGQVPFSGETPVTVGYKHVQEPPEMPSKLNPRAGGAIETVLLKALAKDPGDRYQTGKDLAMAMETAVADLQDNTLNTMYEKACALQAERQFEAALQEMENLAVMQPDYRDTTQRIADLQASQLRQEQYQEMGKHWQTAQTLANDILAAEPNFPDQDKYLEQINKPPEIIEKEVPITKIIRKEVYVTDPTWDWVNLLRTSGITFLLSSLFFGFWAQGYVGQTGVWSWTSSLAIFSFDYSRGSAFLIIGVSIVYLFLLFFQINDENRALWPIVLRIPLNIVAIFFTSSAYLNFSVSTGPWLMLVGFLCLLISDIWQLVVTYQQKETA